jgi:multiple sugar transport system ATP-binding protein
MTLATRIVVIREGKVQQAGSPREIYARPANRFVASFVGSPAMSFVAGSLETSGQGARFLAPDFPLDLEAYSFDGATNPRPQVVLGLRPEAVAIGSGGPLSGRVQVVELLGMLQVVWVDVGGQVIAGLVPADASIAPDTEVRLAVDAARVSLFDGATGARL